MFTAGVLPDIPYLARPGKLHLATGPISESDFFTWEALISGPKDTPFVRADASYSSRIPRFPDDSLGGRYLRS
jgi:hypothetical protein